MPAFRMVKQVFTNLIRPPVTERYPFVEKKFIPGTRGSIGIEIEKCIYCGICQRKCPTAAITVSKEQKSWAIDRMRCISCSACIEACPKKCLLSNVKYSACSATVYTDTFSSPVAQPQQRAAA